MDNIVHVTIIRHAHSVANEYFEKNKIHATDEKYINAGLSDLGKYQIRKVRYNILRHIVDYDMIITSPLKRAIQTCLLVYEDQKMKKNGIKIAAIVSEFGFIMENKFVSRSDNKKDGDIINLPNFDCIDWGDHDIYDATWKNNYNNNNPRTDQSFYDDYNKRINLFKSFLGNSIFTNKKIVIFSHCMFIKKLFTECPDNLGMVKFTYNQKTKTFTLITQSDFNVPKDIKLDPCRGPHINPIPIKVIKPINPNVPVVEGAIQNSSNINVLSFNVGFQGMFGIATGSVKTACPKSEKDISITLCLENVVEFIDKECSICDFIGLQESVMYETMILKSKKLDARNMSHENYTIYNVNNSNKNIKSSITTFYDKKYKLDNSFKVKGWMSDRGRPYIILFFDNNLCVINLHAGHRSDAYKFESYVNEILNATNFVPKMADSEIIGDRETIKTKLSTYNIILMGDFNDNLDKPLKFFGRTFHGYNKTITCCSDMLQTKMTLEPSKTTGMQWSPDQIITTFKNISTRVLEPSVFTSDHLPITAKIETSTQNQTGGELDSLYYHKYIKYKTKYIKCIGYKKN